MNAKQILLLLSWVVTLGSGAPAADEVKSVPSCNFQPNFRHYSGYLNATSQAQLHYWLVESQANPQSDPVILWLNGKFKLPALRRLVDEP
uniref:Uncharacterized protein n=1 Tax=Plectus sambesii TaxID=2011161 RepID=A0A914UWP2_9BILA